MIQSWRHRDCPGGRSATLSQRGKQVQVLLLDGPEDAELVAMDAAHLRSSPGPVAGERGAEGVRKLAIKLQGISKVRLVVALVPRDEAEMPPWKIVPLACWSAGRG